jgi:ipoprotein LpqH
VDSRRAVTAVVALTLAGCSSSPPEYRPPAGQLVAGTAAVTVNGQDTGTTTAVRCNAVGPLTTIKTGTDASGISALIGSGDELVVREVGIRDLGGFTGSYNEGLGGEATVSMADRTYEIAGAAEGFDTAKPSFRTSGTFSIKVSC